jgi:radical SAM protein with 4Fe4S-binding SPASM domain
MGLKETRSRLPIIGQLPEASLERRFERRSNNPAPLPRYAVWELTLACDQACVTCGPRAGQARPNELDTDEALSLVESLKEMGVHEVTLIGGEAYLRNDFLLITRAIRVAGMTCTMTTGGYNLTQERAEAAVEAGVQSVSVSFDGLPDTHDRLRARADSFVRAERALGYLREAGSQVTANTQINAETYRELPELLERLAPMGINGWQLQLTVAHGGGADDPARLLQPYEMPEMYEVLEQLLDRGKELGIRILPTSSVGYFGPLEERMRAPMTTRGHYSGCSAGVHALGIQSDGGIKGCPSLGGRNNVGGNVRESSLREIWEESWQLRWVSERSQKELWGFCAQCYYADVCMGGCSSIAEPLLGRPGNNPMCVHRALDLRSKGERERIERVRAPVGDPFDAGLFRIVREELEPKAPGLEREVLGVEEPRVDRWTEPWGSGSVVDVKAGAGRDDPAAAAAGN